MASNDQHEDRSDPDPIESVTGLDAVWSSIGPGRTDAVDDTPPTIRPYDPLTRPPATSRDLERRLPIAGVEPMPMSESEPNRSERPGNTDDVADPTADRLRDELRLGARMIEALENQIGRAERLIRLEEQASTRLSDRMHATDSVDTRLEEIEATLSTIERRLDRQASTRQPGTPRSGSLSIGTDHEPAGSDSADHEVLERARSIRGELRRELEAICSATASLAEVVEQAGRTEQLLRGTLEAAGGVGSESGSPKWSVSSILRRLAEEFDLQAGTTDAATGDGTAERRSNLVVEVDATNETVASSLGSQKESPSGTSTSA